MARASVETTPGPDLSHASQSARDSVGDGGRFVAFASSVPDLVDGDGNNLGDVFVRDVASATTTRVSVDVNGGDANGPSEDPAMTPDGRFVAFVSSADDLVANDGNDDDDVFVRDLQSQTTVRVSVGLTPGANNGGLNGLTGLRSLAITPDGRYVAFGSHATDLVDGAEPNSVFNIFVRDLQAGTTVQASLDASGGEPNDYSEYPSLSADGNRVAFRSFASDLVAGDNNGEADIFVRDIAAGTTVRASVDSTGGDAVGGSVSPSLSADGNFVSFASDADDLVAGGAPASFDIYRRNLTAGTTERVSVAANPADPGGSSLDSDISGDGRFVAFESFAADLVADDNNDATDVFVRDMTAGTTTRVSLTALGNELGDELHDSRVPSISPDGDFVSFTSRNKFVTGDRNGSYDVFVRAVRVPQIASVVPATAARGNTIDFTISGADFAPNAFVRATTASGSSDGLTVDAVDVVSATHIEATITIAPSTPTGTLYLFVVNPGPGPGAVAGSAATCTACPTISE
jgi:Tol biopolymer transport system component